MSYDFGVRLRTLEHRHGGHRDTFRLSYTSDGLTDEQGGF